MEFPKFLLGDNTDFPTAIFVIHTDYPRFIINLEDDSVEWLEDFSPEDEKELETETEGLIQAATDFYDREISRYEAYARATSIHRPRSFCVSQWFGKPFMGCILVVTLRKGYWRSSSAFFSLEDVPQIRSCSLFKSDPRFSDINTSNRPIGQRV